MDRHLLGSSVHEILQARILEWVAFPPPGDLPDPGIKPASPALAGGFFTTEPPGKLGEYIEMTILLNGYALDTNQDLVRSSELV